MFHVNVNSAFPLTRRDHQPSFAIDHRLLRETPLQQERLVKLIEGDEGQETLDPHYSPKKAIHMLHYNP